MAKPRTEMNETTRKYFDKLTLAEFGDEEQDIEPDNKEFAKLLKRALKWKTHDRLEWVCEYLGAEEDERVETIDGCKEIIKETVEYLQGVLKHVARV